MTMPQAQSNYRTNYVAAPRRETISLRRRDEPGVPGSGGSGNKTGTISARLSEAEEVVLEFLKKRLRLSKDSEVVGVILRAFADKPFEEILDFLYRDGDIGEERLRVLKAQAQAAASQPLLGMRAVPIVQTIAAGELAFADQALDDIEYLSVTGINCPANVVALRVSGDSMSSGGGGINDGDFVLISEAPVGYGEIAAVRVDNKATLKRVFQRPGDDTVCLRALNSDYDDQIVSVKDFKAYPVCTVVPGDKATILNLKASGREGAI